MSWSPMCNKCGSDRNWLNDGYDEKMNTVKCSCGNVQIYEDPMFSATKTATHKEILEFFNMPDPDKDNAARREYLADYGKPPTSKEIQGRILKNHFNKYKKGKKQ